ncbi:Acg family FMN-binding oxidoreductase [Mycolicibacterium sp. XJ1819]
MTTGPTDTDVITTAVELACRAPSLHNSQPWRWVATATGVELLADPHRVVRSADDAGREALISCGAALHHFCIAMAAAGFDTDVELFPDAERSDHIASIRLTALQRVPQGAGQRVDAILRRRTDRLPFRAPPDWESFEEVLADLVDGDLMLDVLDADARARLVGAARLVESLRRDDDFYHRELQWWTAPFRLSEGVPSDALVSDSERQRVPTNRNFRPSGHADRRPTTAQDEAKILVLTSASDTREAAVECGVALSRVLLECTVAGFTTCTVTHVTEMAQGREIVGELTGRGGMPQVLIRVGSAPSIEEVSAPTPRRPVREVLRWVRR